MDKGTYLESKYINAYCQSKEYKHYIIRLDHYVSGWYMVSGFLSNADSAKKKKYMTIFDKYRSKKNDTSVQNDNIEIEKEINMEGGLFSSDSYSCPYCGNTDIVRCGQCGEVCCNARSSKYFRCKCGNSGKVAGNIKSLKTINNGAEKMKKK